ncbi:MAG: sigma-54 dependent transcriptional regulator [Acidobacteriota bacterium]
MTKILVVDDEDSMREVLAMRLPPWGFEICLAADAAQARKVAERERPDIAILDLSLPDDSGLELLRALKRAHPRLEVVMATAFGTIDAAVEAIQYGARDFLTKPLDYERLRKILDTMVRDLAADGDRERLDKTLDESAGLGEIVGTSRPMRKLYRLLKILGANEASALITGESGTGKELVARTIHDLSARSGGRFVAVNVAAIPDTLAESELFGHEKGAFTGAVSPHPGWFEQADGGTLMLDELGEMPMTLQPKLLRVLEESKVRRLGGTRDLPFDVRMLAATNRDPRRAIEDEKLREDLYYRLNVFTLELPPLRKRLDDIPLLAQSFIRRFNRKHETAVEGLADPARERLQEYGWPGNVRELRNVLEYAVILAHDGMIQVDHLPRFIRRPAEATRPPLVLSSKVTLAEAERLLVLETLKSVGHNKAAAARRLGLDVKTIRNKLKTYEAARGGE